jgi:hypothetical protein
MTEIRSQDTNNWYGPSLLASSLEGWAVQKQVLRSLVKHTPKKCCEGGSTCQVIGGRQSWLSIDGQCNSRVCTSPNKPGTIYMQPLPCLTGSLLDAVMKMVSLQSEIFSYVTLCWDLI